MELDKILLHFINCYTKQLKLSNAPIKQEMYINKEAYDQLIVYINEAESGIFNLNGFQFTLIVNDYLKFPEHTKY